MTASKARPTRTGRTAAPKAKAKRDPVWVGERREVGMDTIPRCDFCTDSARYDAASITGPWGYFCARHFAVLGNGKLGVGYGQEIVQTKGAS